MGYFLFTFTVHFHSSTFLTACPASIKVGLQLVPVAVVQLLVSQLTKLCAVVPLDLDQKPLSLCHQERFSLSCLILYSWLPNKAGHSLKSTHGIKKQFVCFSCCYEINVYTSTSQSVSRIPTSPPKCYHSIFSHLADKKPSSRVRKHACISTEGDSFAVDV